MIWLINWVDLLPSLKWLVVKVSSAVLSGKADPNISLEYQVVLQIQWVLKVSTWKRYEFFPSSFLLLLFIVVVVIVVVACCWCHCCWCCRCCCWCHCCVCEYWVIAEPRRASSSPGQSTSQGTLWEVPDPHQVHFHQISRVLLPMHLDIEGTNVRGCVSLRCHSWCM